MSIVIRYYLQYVEQVPNLFSGKERRKPNNFTLLALGGNEREILSALPSHIDILFSRVSEFTQIEVKNNTYLLFLQYEMVTYIF